MKLLIMPAINSGPHLGLIIFLSPLFSNTLSLCFSRTLRDQFSHPYKTMGKLVVLYIWKTGRQNILDGMTALSNKLDTTGSEVMKNKAQDYFYVCTVPFAHSFYINQQSTIYIFLFEQYLYYNHSYMLRYNYIIFREFHSCTSLKLSSFYFLKFH